MSTIDDLRELTAVVGGWLAAPSVWPFDTSHELFGAEQLELWYDGFERHWNFGFGYDWIVDHPDSAKYVFDLRRYGVTTHQEAIDYLNRPEWDVDCH